jgi:hypothetical protein
MIAPFFAWRCQDKDLDVIPASKAIRVATFFSRSCRYHPTAE